MMARFISILFWLFFGASSLLLFPIAALIWLATSPFDRRRVVLHAFTCLWASLYTWCNPLWRVRVVGRDKIRPGARYMMVANHASAVDIFVLFRLFRHFKWVSKIENFRVPCIGWNMRLNGYIALRRGDRSSVVAMLEACARTLAQGSSVMMFPEGTRSRDGNLQPFKAGAFEIAKRSGVPILPVIVEGTRRALPKKGLWVARADILVRVLDPISPETFGSDSADALANRVREHFVASLGQAA
jgi:1-acyl-sn-glycerol-3-phosphate acyltransferase